MSLNSFITVEIAQIYCIGKNLALNNGVPDNRETRKKNLESRLNAVVEMRPSYNRFSINAVTERSVRNRSVISDKESDELITK